MSEKWSYCPECGSDAIHYEEGDHKQRADCHQEWFADIDYSDVVRKHLAGHYSNWGTTVERKDAALAAKDVRIAELEGVLAKALAFTEANTFGGTDALALIEECHAALAIKQQAEPTMAKNANVAATHSEDGREVVTDIADLFADSKCAICGDTGHFVVDDTGPEYVTSPCHECNAPDAWRMFDGEGGYDYTHDEETAERWKKHCGEKYASWVEQLYLAPPTSAQHSRIVAAKDAEIAQWREQRNDLIEGNNILHAELATERQHAQDQHAAWIVCDAERQQLRAQPARQVGVDERAKFNAWNNGTDCPLAGRDTKTGAWMAWQARAAIAPAAVVMPDRKDVTLATQDDDWPEVVSRRMAQAHNAALDEVARLNRRAIPVGLLERIAEHLEWDGKPEMDAYTYTQRSDNLALELRALLGEDGSQ